MTETLAIPSHVAPDRVRDVDVFQLPGSDRDVHRAWLKLAEGPDLIWSPRNGGHWIATGGSFLLSLFKGDERFSNRETAVPAGSMLVPTLPIQADGEAHKAYRALIEPAFKPAAVEKYARRARELTIEIIERLIPTGQCEFTGDYTEVDGAPIRADDLIMLPSSLHGLDSREFENPLDVDFERPAKAATTFGAGVHRCPGASLARLEMKIMVEEWLRRIPDFEIDPTRTLVQSSGLVNGILELPLRWSATSPAQVQ